MKTPKTCKDLYKHSHICSYWFQSCKLGDSKEQKPQKHGEMKPITLSWLFFLHVSAADATQAASVTKSRDSKHKSLMWN